MEDDLYEVLGVLPSAEDIVITAAYRVLAQRFHPDRWTGPPSEAHERMAAINRAYETLRDPARRAAYDSKRTRNEQARYEQPQDQGREAMFEQAINDLEARWKIAADVLPDLNALRGKLAKLSSALAFSYVTVLLEKKAFNDRKALSERMQDLFLERYFGTDPKIKEVALHLILTGHRDAAKTLNELVDVMGSAIDPSNLIAAVDSKHGDALQNARNASAKARAVEKHLWYFLKSPCLEYLWPLCHAAGFEIEVKHQGFFKDPHYVVSRPLFPTQTFTSANEFISWGLKEFN